MLERLLEPCCELADLHVRARKLAHKMRGVRLELFDPLCGTFELVCLRSELRRCSVPCRDHFRKLGLRWLQLRFRLHERCLGLFGARLQSLDLPRHGQKHLVVLLDLLLESLHLAPQWVQLADIKHPETLGGEPLQLDRAVTPSHLLLDFAQIVAQ
jgi:hypothetical protein